MKKIIVSCLVGLILLGASPQLVKAKDNLNDEVVETSSRSTTIKKCSQEDQPRPIKEKN